MIVNMRPRPSVTRRASAERAAELRLVVRFEPPVVGEFERERAGLGGHLSGHIGDAALAERFGDRRDEGEPFQRLALP